jgi:hypothetical protein
VFPIYFKEEFITNWNIYNNFHLKVLFLLQKTAFGLTTGLTAGLPFGLAGGLASILSLYISYFRFIFYPIHLLVSLFILDFKKNSYLWDAVIWLPIPFARKQLVAETWKNTKTAFHFTEFLLEYRPLQRGLAFHLIHTATAATWFEHPLKFERLIEPGIEGMEEPKQSSVQNKYPYTNLLTLYEFNHILRAKIQ